MIQTERLMIRAASDTEMRELIAKEPDEGVKAAYGEMLSLSIENPSLREWYAAWLITLTGGERVGELCFRGLPADGAVELGCGLLPDFWGKGYATEAVIAVTEWALKQPGVSRIEAEAEEDNLASLRVLEKAGFVPTGERGEEGPRFVWRGTAP